MKVDFVVEDFSGMKYIGCSTLAKSLYENLSIKKEWNSAEDRFDITHFHTFGPFAWYVLLKSTCPSVLTAHSTPKANSGNVPFSENFWKKIYRKIYNKFDHIIAVSETSREELIDMGIDRDISVIYNGVDRDKFSFSEERREKVRERLGLEDDDFLVINVGQKTLRKGVFDFIEISRRIPDAEFMWVGGMPYSVFSSGYSKIKKYTERDYDNLKFPGFVDSVVDYYCAADLFLVTSNFETFGLTVLEAMSMGLPVVLKGLEVFRELFSGVGLICGDLSEMVESIRKIKSSKNTKRKYKEKSLSHAQKFDIKNIAKKHVDLYKKLS